MKKGLLLFVGVLCASTLLAAGSGNSGSGDLTHRMMTLAIQLGVILFAARMGNILFTWLKLPSVLGELCAGIAIGPYALGALWPGWIFQVFEMTPGVAILPWGRWSAWAVSSSLTLPVR